MDRTLLRHVPAVDRLQAAVREKVPGCPDALAATIAREVADFVRGALISGQIAQRSRIDPAVDDALSSRCARLLHRSLRPVINGTGVLIHTNAGRAPLSAHALAAVAATSAGYCNLELELADGRRGKRGSHVRDLLRWASGADDATVVNNNAAAVMLTLHALAKGRPVLVSRGELVEIGGSFRVPDVMAAAGARLVEVGTTNRTWPRDYERAAQELTDAGDPPAVMMQVHRSNFRLQGFVATPTVTELAPIAARFGMPLVVDLGSGALTDPTPLGLADEPTVAQTIAAGADIATFSGDKLVGGPQAGAAVGKTRWIQLLKGNAMARAVRVDSMTLAALEATLRDHLLGRAREHVPVVRAATWPLESLRGDAERVITALAELPVIAATIVPSSARMGGGSQPEEELPSIAVSLCPTDGKTSRLAQRLRSATPPILARVHQDRVLLDMRSVRCTSVASDPIGQLCDTLTAALQHGA